MMRVKGKFKLDVRNEVMRALIRQDTEYLLRQTFLLLTLPPC